MVDSVEIDNEESNQTSSQNQDYDDNTPLFAGDVEFRF
jgi:hypothetical protein